MDIIALLDKFKLWQFTLLMSIVLLSLGFTGQSLIPGDEIVLAGKENMAIAVGVVCLILTCILKYLPPPESRSRGERPTIAISSTQTALAASLQDWTTFAEAAQRTTADHKLPVARLRTKNTELRLELATLQGLLMRDVDGDGNHLVKYRYSDETTYVPS